MSKVEDEISALKAAVGAASDAQLTEIIGYSHGAITQWRNRGKVPDKARRLVEAYKQGGRRQLRMDARRRELGAQVLYEGRCLALFLAPSVDAASSRRFSPTNYAGTLRNYTSLFDEIALACAGAIHERMIELEVKIATDAFESLAQGNLSSLYNRVMQEAMKWRYDDDISRLNSASDEFS